MSPSERDDGSAGSHRTDGGVDGTQPDASRSPDQDLFTRTADVSAPSRKERLYQAFDQSIYAPLAVAWNDWRARAGILILGFFVFMGTVGVVVVDQTAAMEGPIFAPPLYSMKHPLGTDYLGRDMLTMLVHATPAMLKIVMAGAIFSVVVGTLIGTVAGYKGGFIDSVLMTITDIVLTIPALVLIIVLAAIYPPENPYLVGLLLGIDNWPPLARTLRSQVLSIREEAHTEASRIMGISQLRIFRRDIMSNLMPYISINFATASRSVVFESVGLYFLGILPFTTNNWGVMMNQAYQTGDITDPAQLHWLFLPMFAIILFSLGFILFAQGLDRVFNVRLQARHAKTSSDEEEEDTVMAEL